MKNKFLLSKISLALSLCYAGLSYAEIQSANHNTQVERQNGVEIVNIATPTASGLSHNQYHNYNVEQAGAVLNNAQQNAQSQLAGNVAANPHLTQRAADVILNEVVSRNPSTLAGKQEVVGKKADYVLANPNGISCQGCGFINMPKASLVVGKPEVADGKLKGYEINGDKDLTTGGNVQAEDLDLLAPKVSIGGDIKAKDVNIVQGTNKITRQDNGDLTVQAQQSEQILDGKVAGSIQAGRIRIHSTNERALLHITGSDLKAKDEISVIAGNAKLDGVVSSTQSNDENHTTEADNVKLATKHTASEGQYQTTELQADNVVIGSKNKLDVNGAKIKAKNATVTAKEMNFGTQATVSSTTKTTERKKGLWYRNESESSRIETLHRTEITADNVKIASEGTVRGSAVKVEGKSIGIYAKDGIELKGDKEVSRNSKQADFNNETSKLKKGVSQQESEKENYIASELNSQSDLLLGSGKNIHLYGVQSKTDGNLIVKADQGVKFYSEVTSNKAKIDDKQKFWGGLAGSESFASDQDSQIQHGSDFTVKGTVSIEAERNVGLSGSRVLAGKDGYVKSKRGKLIVDSVTNDESVTQSSRKGTVFDITKARDEKYTQTSSAQGSTLKSSSNLKLAADNLDIVGSTVVSSGLLDIAALSGINVKGAENTHSVREHSAGFDWFAKADKPVIELDKASIINSAVDEVTKVIDGKTNFTDAVKNVAKKAIDSTTKVDLNASVGLNVHNKRQAVDEVTETASTLTGSNVNLNAKDVKLQGGNINATEGDINIHADNVEVAAGHEHSVKKNTETSGGISDNIHVTEKGLSNTLTVGVKHSDTKTETDTAKGAKLSATNDINIKANSLSHQGSGLTAGNNIKQDAKSIRHLAAENKQVTHNKTANAGLSIETTFDREKVLNGKANLVAEGGNDNGTKQTAQATKLNAGKDITINSDKLTDQGTQYTAKKDLTLVSKEHNLTSTTDEVTNDKLNAGANVSLTLNTKDFSTFNAEVAAGAKFQKDQTTENKAQKAKLQAGNVNISTGKLNSQADISATQNVKIKAKEAKFTQSENTETAKGGGADVKLGVGALVIPAAAAAVPSINAGVNANTNSKQKVEAVTGDISGKKVTIDVTDNVHLQGTNIKGTESAVVSGKKVNIEAAHNNAHESNTAGGINVKIGADKSSVGVDTKLNIKRADADTHNNVVVNGDNVALKAEDGVTLTGVNSTSKKLALDSGRGGLKVNAAEGNVNKADLGIGVVVNGNLKDKVWEHTGSSGSLNVEVVHNQPKTTSELTGKDVAMNVGGNAHFKGGIIKAENVNGTIGGDLNSQPVSDKTSEKAINLSVSVSGKGADYASGNWAENLKKDWENGTIAGLKAEGKFGLKNNVADISKEAGIQATNNNIKVNGKVVSAEAAKPVTKKLEVTANLTSDIKKMLTEKDKIISVKSK